MSPKCFMNRPYPHQKGVRRRKLAAKPAAQRNGCGRRIAAAMSTPSFSAHEPMFRSCAARTAQVLRALEMHGVQPRTACC